MKAKFSGSLAGVAMVLLACPLAICADWQVTLGNCSEFVGVASIPVARVQALVPASYQIAVGPPGFASLVVRTSLCRTASIGNGPVNDARVAQIGVVVVPPDGTGDINSYTLAYTTDNALLALRLGLDGVPVTFDGDLVYEVTPNPPGAGGAFFADVSPLASAGWMLSGTVSDPPPNTAFPFTANWWVKTQRGTVKMSTSVALLGYGSGAVTAHTRRQSLLGRLVDGNSSGFGTNLRGVFANAVMTVKVQ